MNPVLANNVNLDKTRKDNGDSVFSGNSNLDNPRDGGFQRLPVWLKQEIPDKIVLERARVLSESGLHTVCHQANCPNLGYCLRQRKVTFMILGDTCSRNCRFCAVKKSGNENLKLDLEEPLRIAGAVKELGLDYAVITSVTRDDLNDAGAGIFAQTIDLIHKLNRNIKIEVLIPDFKGKLSSLKCVLDARPCVVGHNIETVESLYRDLRPKANYRLSLQVLRSIKEIQPLAITKSSIMLGLGEKKDALIRTMRDLLNSGCDILTLGQYLAPSFSHYPVKEFISPEQFHKYRDFGLALGFKSVLSGPLVRSSYNAEEVYRKLA